MSGFTIKYDGKLRTSAQHLDSGVMINTDAPKDNHGLGECFSPTDMVCTALVSCMLTIMAIAVEKKGSQYNWHKGLCFKNNAIRTSNDI